MASIESPPKPLGSILVIGGCGFLGHNIVKQLLSPQYSSSVSVLDLRTTHNRFPNVAYYDADITSASAVADVYEKVRPQTIIHTASPTVYADNPQPALYKKVNVDGTRNLLDRAGDLGCVKAFIYTSSASVVHDGIGDLTNASELWPVLRTPIQQEAYSDTKAEAEGLVLAANRNANMLTCSIRPAAIFGEGDVQMVPVMHIAYLKGQTGFQLGVNDNIYDFTYVGNIALAHILATQALLTTHARLPSIPLDYERVDGEAFFITNGEPMYFWDFARTIWKYAGDTKEPQKDVWVIPRSIGLPIASIIEWAFWIIWQGKAKPNLTRRIVNYSCMTRYYNIDKARKRLGYEPQVDMQEAIRRTMEWLRGKEGGLGKDLLEKRHREKDTEGNGNAKKVQ
ncbi:erg26, C-3 sterol dehydrogenase [Xylographa carneopallida]|nr:erg26, C-3 sterol dehydrogenase [Xylographa carneopallida]